MGVISSFPDREPIDFAALIAAVARELWGEPNKRLSKPGELRWGNQGARIVYPGTGAFKDTEADRSGGTLDLIQHAQGVDKAGAMAWLSERGLIADGRQSSTAARQHAIKLHSGQRIIRTHTYSDAHGALLYRKHRIEPGRGNRGKEFAYDRPNGSGGWQWGRGDAQVPYRLPQLASAPKGELIYMAEGEAKADKLASWGLTATSSKDWRGYDFSGYVRGRTVIILPDNDETGERLAEKVAADVERAEGRPVIVRLPGLPEKGDVLDWSGDAEELARLVASAELGGEGETLELADLDEWALTPAKPTPFYVPGFIPEEEVTIVTGDGGGNKSTFAHQLCACSAARKQMLGLDVKPGITLYITAEDKFERLKWVQEHICRTIGVSMASLKDRLHLASIRGRLNNELATFDPDGRLQVREAYHLIRRTLVKTEAKLMVLDNVAHLFAGNENDRGQVTAFVNLLYALCRELGVTIVLIAHKNKAGDSYSGSTAWLNAVRSQLVLERPAEGHDPDARILTVGKANYARPDQSLAFRWHNFALVRDQDLSADVRDEIAAVARDNADDAAFLACLAERTRQEQAVSEKVSSTYAPKVFADMPESRRAGQKRMEHAMNRLIRRGEIARDMLPWKRDRKDVYGLRLTCADAAQTGCADVPDLSAPTARNTHPYTTDNAGAASKAAPPAPRGEGKRDLSRIVFSAPTRAASDDGGLTADDMEGL